MQSATTSANPPTAGRFREAEPPAVSRPVNSSTFEGPVGSASHAIPAVSDAPPPVAVGSIVAKRAVPTKRRRWFELPLDWLDRFRNVSAMTISGLIHVLLIFILALIATLQSNPGPRGIEIASSVVNESVAIPSFELVKPDAAVPTPEASDTSETARFSTSTDVRIETTVESTTSQAISLANLAPIQIKTELDAMVGSGSTFTPSHSVFAHSSLDGRTTENRSKLALSRGGSQASEQAVEAALVWLTAHQHQDGGWSMMLTDPTGPCNGKCRHSTIEMLDAKRFAATGLALLTYLGAGYTHRDGKYREQVYRGLMFLMDRMKLDAPTAGDGRFPGQFASPLSRHQMYEQGIASLALCEAYQMTGDKILERSSQKAADFIQRAQHYDGSWGYRPREPGDLSIVGWQMMTLKSANAGDLQVEPVRINRVDGFLNSRQSAGGSKYSYQGPAPSRSMTAIGLLMRLYLGYPRTAPMMIAGSAYIAEKGPSEADVYFNYYATQTLFQLEAIQWKQWNELLREYLIKTQSKAGHEAGSWFFDDGDSPFNHIGGRLYTTTLSAMTLEVYYRYMPVYKNTTEQPFKL